MENQTLVKEICPTTTQGWVAQGALLVDVREKDEVEELAYDVPSILNIPLSEFEDRYTEIPQDKEVVMVCRGGGRSLRAAGFLINHGYNPEKVVNMKLGIIRWVEKGFPTKGNQAVVASQGSGCCGTPVPAQSSVQSSCCGSSSKAEESKCC